MGHQTVIFITGWGFKASIWKELLIQLNIKNYQLYELPMLEKITLESVVRHLEKFIPPRSIIIGWSLGAIVAIKFATLFPNRCKQLALISTTPKFSESENWKGIDPQTVMSFQSTFAQHPQRGLKRFLKLVNYPNRDPIIKHYISAHSIFDKKHGLILEKYLQLLFKSDVREAYAKLNIPTCHFLGEKDAVVKVDPSQLSQLNKAVDIIPLKNAGHAPLITHSSLLATILNPLLYEKNCAK